MNLSLHHHQLLFIILGLFFKSTNAVEVAVKHSTPYCAVIVVLIFLTSIIVSIIVCSDMIADNGRRLRAYDRYHFE